MSDGSRYYDHKLTNIEKGKLIDMIKEAPNSSVSISTQTPESSAFSGIKDNRLISILQTNASKIVDANSEPSIKELQQLYTHYVHNERGNDAAFHRFVGWLSSLSPDAEVIPNNIPPKSPFDKGGFRGNVNAVQRTHRRNSTNVVTLGNATRQQNLEIVLQRLEIRPSA